MVDFSGVGMNPRVSDTLGKLPYHRAVPRAVPWAVPRAVPLASSVVSLPSWFLERLSVL